MTAMTDEETAGFTPGRLNIIITTGSPWSLTLEWDDDSGTMNLDGYVARMVWTDVPPNATVPDLPAAQCGPGSPNMIFSLNSAQTAPLSFIAIGYQLLVTDPSGNELPWLEGVVTLNGSGQ